MSVRVAYLRRDGRGVALRGVRLIGQSSDQSWPPADAPIAGFAADIDAAAAWIGDRLAEGRGGRSLAQIVLDSEGGVCSWISTPSAANDVVGALARSGPDAGSGFGDDAASKGPRLAPLPFFAGSGLDATVQALPSDAAVLDPTAANADGTPNTAGPMRLPVLAVTDLPARLLVDALDRRGVDADGVTTVWHAMAQVWDPAAKPRSNDPLTATDRAMTAVVLVDPWARAGAGVGTGRLLWAWSAGGQLLAAGSLRLRSIRPAAPDTDPEGASADAGPVPVFGADDAARLAGEWLGWAAQLGRAPERIACVVPASEGFDDATLGPAALGQSLTRAWPGATVDLALHDDPIAATLRAFAERLEATPSSELAAAGPGRSLLEASARPRRTHRRLHLWIAGAIAAAAVALVVTGVRLRAAADDAAAKTRQWQSGWRDKVKALHPEAFDRESVGIAPATAMGDAIKKLEDQMAPIEKSDASRPVLAELETISLVVGNSGLSLASLDVDAQRAPNAKVVATSPDLKSAEALLEALNRIAGTHLGVWTANYVTETTATNDTKYRGTYTARWAPPASGKPAAPAGGSGGTVSGGGS